MSKLSEYLRGHPQVQPLLTQARNASDQMYQAVEDALNAIFAHVEQHGNQLPPLAPTNVAESFPDYNKGVPLPIGSPANDVQWPSVTGGAELAHGLVSPALPSVSKRSDT